ncbi:DUF1501 domain-containing protein [Aestuariispira insulae]|uniref:Uncharacterized protein (DUF1501 family) n=1 Tax=Aestuariispira insulae TaxID=1461337 RepID=A0A3D9HS72_9PROT|nr:DUF1501 domain-containing protein [Aestuariispira insulae]RED52347.1 uncharacterized protein (DUF1501 family) [Aestuariispira insulae]
MKKQLPITRRSFLSATAAGMAVTAFPFGNLSLAKVNRDARFILVLARGGMDGLALFPPHGDPDYRKIRGRLALPKEEDGGFLKLDRTFGLHPAASQLLPFWKRKEMAIVPAAANSYRGNAHREALLHLDSGLDAPSNPQSGWLNRAINAMGGEAVPAVSISDQLPLVLAGPDEKGLIQTVPAATSSLPGFYQRVALLYQDDPLLRTALAQEMGQQQNRQSGLTEDDQAADAGARPVSELSVMVRTAAKALRAQDGARIAVIETSGWDTHAAQGSLEGQLARRFSSLAGGLELLASEMRDDWDKTVVVVATEFGRTNSPNKDLGTDHGLASPMMVLGGAIKGGKTVGAWPGLVSRTSELSKALQPSEDIRAVFKSVLVSHMGVEAATVDKTVFPNSEKIKPLSGLL